MGFISKGLKNEFKTSVVNGPIVFEPLKFYCIYLYFVKATFVATLLYAIISCFVSKEADYLPDRCLLIFVFLLFLSYQL